MGIEERPPPSISCSCNSESHIHEEAKASKTQEPKGIKKIKQSCLRFIAKVQEFVQSNKGSLKGSSIQVVKEPKREISSEKVNRSADKLKSHTAALGLCKSLGQIEMKLSKEGKSLKEISKDNVDSSALSKQDKNIAKAFIAWKASDASSRKEFSSFVSEDFNPKQSSDQDRVHAPKPSEERSNLSLAIELEFTGKEELLNEVVSSENIPPIYYKLGDASDEESMKQELHGIQECAASVTSRLEAEINKLEKKEDKTPIDREKLKHLKGDLERRNCSKAEVNKGQELLGVESTTGTPVEDFVYVSNRFLAESKSLEKEPSQAVSMMRSTERLNVHFNNLAYAQQLGGIESKLSSSGISLSEIKEDQLGDTNLSGSEKKLAKAFIEWRDSDKSPKEDFSVFVAHSYNPSCSKDSMIDSPGADDVLATAPLATATEFGDKGVKLYGLLDEDYQNWAFSSVTNLVNQFVDEMKINSDKESDQSRSAPHGFCQYLLTTVVSGADFNTGKIPKKDRQEQAMINKDIKSGQSLFDKVKPEPERTPIRDFIDSIEQKLTKGQRKGLNSRAIRLCFQRRILGRNI